MKEGASTGSEPLDFLVYSNGRGKEVVERMKGVGARMTENESTRRQYEGYMTRLGADEAERRAECERYCGQLAEQQEQMRSETEQLRASLLEYVRQAVHYAGDAVSALTEQELTAWRVEQKHAQYKPKAEQHRLKEALDTRFEPLLERAGAELRALRGLLSELSLSEEESASGDVHRLSLTLHSQIKKFIQQSCVVAQQPPVALTTVRPPKPTKRGATGDKVGGVRSVRRDTQLSCQPVIRLLGGTHLGYRSSDHSQVEAYLISEDQARRLCKEPFDHVVDVRKVGENGQKATFCQNKTRFEMEDSSYVAKFNPPIQMTHVHRSGGRGEELIPQQRYYLLFCVTLGAGAEALRFWKLSLPLAALVHPRQWKEQGADAFIFWEHAFSTGDGMLTYVPRDSAEGVPWPVFAAALNWKFCQLVEGKNEACNHIRPVSDVALANLAEKLFGDQPDYSRCVVTWEMFFKSPSSPETPTTTLREWFYKAAEVIEKYVLKEWNEGYILGFASKRRAEALLSQCSEPTMLIKFSDGQPGCLIISYRVHVSGPVHHLRLMNEDLQAITMAQALAVRELAPVTHVFPSRTVADLRRLTAAPPPADPDQDPANPNANPYGRKIRVLACVEESVPPPPAPHNYEYITPPFHLGDDSNHGSPASLLDPASHEPYDANANWLPSSSFPDSAPAHLMDFNPSDDFADIPPRTF